MFFACNFELYLPDCISVRARDSNCILYATSVWVCTVKRSDSTPGVEVIAPRCALTRTCSWHACTFTDSLVILAFGILCGLAYVLPKLKVRPGADSLACVRTNIHTRIHKHQYIIICIHTHWHTYSGTHAQARGLEVSPSTPRYGRTSVAKSPPSRTSNSASEPDAVRNDTPGAT